MKKNRESAFVLGQLFCALQLVEVSLPLVYKALSSGCASLDEQEEFWYAHYKLSNVVPLPHRGDLGNDSFVEFQESLTREYYERAPKGMPGL